ncbi:MAG: hypothetical protein IPL09_07665 [Bacteroidetes bacterium]|nr:hypothetical protein [Bacteroidota bacterium]
MLYSFQGKKEIKEELLVSISNWLDLKKKPKSAVEISNELFNPIRTFKSAECVLENYEEFPEKLGLPNWLGNLLCTINHNNSKGFNDSKGNYEHFFYPAFIKACKVGVDYSLMFHEWEIMILAEMLPKQERDKQYILDLIQLHKNSSLQKEKDFHKWTKLQNEIDMLLQNIDEFTAVPNDIGLKELDLFQSLAISKTNKQIDYIELQNEAYNFQRFRKSFGQIIWSSGRVAFLSIVNYRNQQNSFTTSSEALIDALVEENINLTKSHNIKTEEEVRRKEWFKLMDRLILMMEKWN